MRRLPRYIAGGPVVGDLAYRLVARALTAERFGLGRDPDVAQMDHVELIDALARELDVDEYDVLLAFAELQRVGVLEPPT